MRRGRSVSGVIAMLVGVLTGCGGDEPGPGSEVGKAGGSGGMAGSGGELSLPGLGGGGAAGGGAGGAAGAAGGSSDGGTSQGGKAGSDSGSAGKSGGGTGGTKPVGMCKRVAGSDVDCIDFWGDDKTQAYACDDTGAASALKNMHDGNCASTSGIPGGNYGMCCAP